MGMNRPSRTVMLTGPQGVGKGEQGKKMVVNMNYNNPFVLGDELRARKDQEVDGPDGRTTIGAIQQSGALVPQPVVMGVTRQYLKTQGEARRLIFDGMPRTPEQADAFDGELKAADRFDDARMVFIDAPRPVVLKNIALRGIIQGRADDLNADAVTTRLDTFYGKTMPVVNRYRKMGKLIQVSGETSFNTERATAVIKRLKELQAAAQLNGHAGELADLEGEWSEIELAMAASINEVHLRVAEALNNDLVSADPSDDPQYAAAVRGGVLLPNS
jgi:adenylate kinase